MIIHIECLAPCYTYRHIKETISAANTTAAEADANNENIKVIFQNCEKSKS